MPLLTMQRALLDWYHRHKADFPWRRYCDPYPIWISETMLQQTTTRAVIPYFERFMARFPTLADLAQASTDDLYEAWAGLGYYSRAHNLHRAAQELHARGNFPQTYQELLTFPGFGPYTARAVASLAFEQSVGVVDGNVIRVLSRLNNRRWEWWKSSVRDEIQKHADAWVQGVSSRDMNQALMELGRTCCTPREPKCLLCPLQKHCEAWKKQTQNSLPLSKPRRAREIWAWKVFLHVREDELYLVQEHSVPFLRSQWMPPNEGQKRKEPPRQFHYKHSITHHDIYVTVHTGTPRMNLSNGKWIPLKEIRRHVPATLVHKALAYLDSADSHSMSQRLKKGRSSKRR